MSRLLQVTPSRWVSPEVEAEDVSLELRRIVRFLTYHYHTGSAPPLRHLTSLPALRFLQFPLTPLANPCEVRVSVWVGLALSLGAAVLHPWGPAVTASVPSSALQSAPSLQRGGQPGLKLAQWLPTCVASVSDGFLPDKPRSLSSIQHWNGRWRRSWPRWRWPQLGDN